MVTIDSHFPGGNIIVDSIDGDVVRLQQDLRTTTEWWFYWQFRVRGAAGRTVRFSFTNKDAFTAAGPCFSEDGVKWRWLGREVLSDNGFSFTFPAGLDTAYFSVGVPYVRQHLDAFLATRPRIERGVLTRTEQGRDAPLLRLRAAKAKHTVCLSARTHACETMASYALEGILDFWLADASADAAWLRDEVDLLVFPLVDADGVEAGDQGKLRAPHDHNRDYLPQPLYATTRGVIAALAAEGDKLRLGLDLHCPWIRSGLNEQFYVVGPPEPWHEPARRLAQVMQEARQGQVPIDTRHYLPFGVDWNKGNVTNTLARHVCQIPSSKVGVSVEVPYALAGGVVLNVNSVRSLGADLGRAVSRYLRE